MLGAASLLMGSSAYSANPRNGVLAKPTGIHDGDTVYFGPVTCRLAKIDAPELDQPFGIWSRRSLIELAGKGRLRYVITGHDDEKPPRAICEIYRARTDLNLKMVKLGYAWHYTRYDNSPEFAAAETEAKDHHRGLWKFPLPCEPETWRNHRDDCPKSGAENSLHQDPVMRPAGAIGVGQLPAQPIEGLKSEWQSGSLLRTTIGPRGSSQ